MKYKIRLHCINMVNRICSLILSQTAALFPLTRMAHKTSHGSLLRLVLLASIVLILVNCLYEIELQAQSSLATYRESAPLLQTWPACTKYLEIKECRPGKKTGWLWWFFVYDIVYFHIFNHAMEVQHPRRQCLGLLLYQLWVPETSRIQK